MISTSATPIDRHRIERIGGDIICDSALTAASSMGVPLTKSLARGRHPRPLRQGRSAAPLMAGLTARINEATMNSARPCFTNPLDNTRNQPGKGTGSYGDGRIGGR